MNKKNIYKIFGYYVKKEDIIEITANNLGYINTTFFIETKNKKYVLQKISTIFNRENICFNIKQIFNYLKEKQDDGKIKKDFKILTPIFLDNQEICLEYNGDFFRLYEFIENSIILDEINISNAKNIGRQIGEFYKYLDGFKGNIKKPFENFHDIKFYFQDYLKIKNKFEEKFEIKNKEIKNNKNIENNIGKINKNKEEIKIENWIKNKEEDIEKYAFLIDKLPKRVIHQDMKLSNMLFDGSGKNLISIVDWDTIDLGSILIDFGDMCRSFFGKMNYDLEIFELFLQGYFTKIKDILIKEEKQNLFLAFEMINLELAVRYYTQYLGGEKVFNLEKEELLQKTIKLYNTQQVINENRNMLLKILKI